MSAQHGLPGPTRDLIGYAGRPPKATWPNGATVALSAIVAYEEGSEYAFDWGDGRNEAFGEVAYSTGPEYRDLCVESVYEYGSRVGVWRILRLLDEYQLKLTFFLAAAAVERNPTLGDAIHQAGHEPLAHGYRWIEHWLLTRDEEREEIRKAVASIEKTCGQRPVGWYCRYGPSIHTRELVVEEGGFRYDSMSYNDDLPYFTEVNGKQHLVIPYNALPYNDVRYILSQGFGSPTEFVDICKRALDEYRLEGVAGYPKMMSVGLHSRYTGQPGRLSGFREFIEYALECGDVWIAPRRDIADWWYDHYEEFPR